MSGPFNRPRPVCSIGAELGEGPVWVPHDEALWFVDITGQRVCRFHPRSRECRVWAAPEKVSFIFAMNGCEFLVGLKSGLHHFFPQSGEFRYFTAVESHLPNNRLNDGCVSREGELWFGSMDDPEKASSGSLYRLDRNGRVELLDSGYGVTNGPAFSPDGCTFYHTDSPRRVIYAFDRSADGLLSRKRVFAQIEVAAGFPDGTTVDAEGCLWVALWGGWAVRRYSPAGELLMTVRFPVAQVTKIAFAGEDRRTVYATTAWRGLSGAEREEQRHAGDLFSFRTAVPGLPSVSLEIKKHVSERNPP
jgi:xylono-1,5-lactonase